MTKYSIEKLRSEIINWWYITCGRRVSFLSIMTTIDGKESEYTADFQWKDNWVKYLVCSPEKVW
jgi:hypothetical protein